MRDIMFLAAWLVFIPLAVQAGVAAGVLLWAWTSLLAPNDMLYGMGAGFPFAKIAAAVTLLLLVARRNGPVRFRLGAAEATMLLLMALSLISQSGTAAADTAPGWDIAQKYLKVLALPLVAMAVMTDRLRIQALVLAICLGMGFTGVAEGAKFLLSGGGHKVLGSASLGDNNQVGLDLLLMLPLLQHLSVVLRHRAVRLVVIGSGLLSMVGVIATASRGAFMGLVLIALATVLTSRRKAAGLVVMVLIGLAGSQIVTADWTARMNTIESADNDDSFMGRVAAWKVSTDLALHRPLGGGFHAIQHPEVWWTYAREAATLPLFPATDPATTQRAAHSIYFEVLGDLGFPGLFLFLLLLASSLRSAMRVRRLLRRAGRPDLDWARDLALRLQISLAVFMASGALLSAAYLDIDYLLIALAVVLRRHVEQALLQAPAGREAAARAMRLPAGIGLAHPAAMPR